MKSADGSRPGRLAGSGGGASTSAGVGGANIETALKTLNYAVSQSGQPCRILHIGSLCRLRCVQGAGSAAYISVITSLPDTRRKIGPRHFPGAGRAHRRFCQRAVIPLRLEANFRPGKLRILASAMSIPTCPKCHMGSRAELRTVEWTGRPRFFREILSGYSIRVAVGLYGECFCVQFQV